EPAEKPVLGGAELPPKYKEYLAEHEKRKMDLENYKASKHAETLTDLRAHVGDYLLAMRDARAQTNQERNLFIQGRKLSVFVADKWQIMLDARAKDAAGKEKDAVFGPWNELVDATNDFTNRAKALVARINQPTTN